MRKSAACLAGVFLVAAMAISQEPPKPSSAPHNKLLDSFVGTWRAEGEFPNMGKYVIDRAYQWSLNEKWLEMTNTFHVASGYEGTVKGVIGWHPGKESLAAWGFSDDGTLSITECKAEEKQITCQGELFGGRNPGPTRSTFRMVSDDEFTEVAETRMPSGWNPMFSFRFLRLKPSAHSGS